MNDDTAPVPVDATPGDAQRKSPPPAAKAVGVAIGGLALALVTVIVLGVLARAAIWVWSGVL